MLLNETIVEFYEWGQVQSYYVNETMNGLEADAGDNLNDRQSVSRFRDHLLSAELEFCLDFI